MKITIELTDQEYQKFKDILEGSLLRYEERYEINKPVAHTSGDPDPMWQAKLSESAHLW